MLCTPRFGPFSPCLRNLTAVCAAGRPRLQTRNRQAQFARHTQGKKPPPGSLHRRRRQRVTNRFQGFHPWAQSYATKGQPPVRSHPSGCQKVGSREEIPWAVPRVKPVGAIIRNGRTVACTQPPFRLSKSRGKGGNPLGGSKGETLGRAEGRTKAFCRTRQQRLVEVFRQLCPGGIHIQRGKIVARGFRTADEGKAAVLAVEHFLAAQFTVVVVAHAQAVRAGIVYQ